MSRDVVLGVLREVLDGRKVKIEARGTSGIIEQWDDGFVATERDGKVEVY